MGPLLRVSPNQGADQVRIHLETHRGKDFFPSSLKSLRNDFSCSCVTKVLISLLALGWGHPLAEIILRHLPCGPPRPLAVCFTKAGKSTSLWCFTFFCTSSSWAGPPQLMLLLMTQHPFQTNLIMGMIFPYILWSPHTQVEVTDPTGYIRKGVGMCDSSDSHLPGKERNSNRTQTIRKKSKVVD